MKFLFFILPFLCLTAAETNNTKRLTDLGFDVSRYDANTLEDAFLTMPQLATKYGYNVETYTVTTIDGYLLEMHRMQSNDPQPIRKAPVFIMHGLQGSSNTFVAPGPNHGLAYRLADMGYDIWLGNGRGNRYSRKHMTLDPDGDHAERDKYWSFSWHEIGIYDLPTMIDKVLETTASEKLHYIGFSQGTTAFWVMSSELPEYNEKIHAMHALAPVAFMAHMNKADFKLMAPFAGLFDLVGSKLLGFYDIPANSDLILKQGLQECILFSGDEKNECVDRVHLKKVGNAYTSLDEINTKLPVAINNIVGGSAMRCYVHYGQLFTSGRFAKFDHGLSNFLVYNEFTPPEYNLENISARIVLYYSNNDDLAAIPDVNKLIDALPNIPEKYLISDPLFTHADFIFSSHVGDSLHNQLFNNLQLIDGQIL